MREPVDKIGFSTRETHILNLIYFSKNINSYYKFKENKEKTFGAICPNDDHLYAAPLYIESLKKIKAKNVILFGVAHRAKKWEIEGKLIF